MDSFFKNKNNFLIISILVLSFFISIIWADSNGIWNNAADLRQGIIGADEQSNPSGFGYSFINDLTINSDLGVNGNLSIFGSNIFNIFQKKIDNINCTNGYVIQTINEDGSVKCVLDKVNDLDSDPNNEKPIAGNGILVNDRTVSIDSTYVQKRISNNGCSDGYVIQTINEDGSVKCVVNNEVDLNNICSSAGGNANCVPLNEYTFVASITATNVEGIKLSNYVNPNVSNNFTIKVDPYVILQGKQGDTGVTGILGSSYVKRSNCRGTGYAYGGNGGSGSKGNYAMDLTGFYGKKITFINSGTIKGGTGGTGGTGGSAVDINTNKCDLTCGTTLGGCGGSGGVGGDLFYNSSGVNIVYDGDMGIGDSGLTGNRGADKTCWDQACN